MRQKEFDALIALLEDPDNEVNRVVTDKIMHEGPGIVPLLENAWESSSNDLMQKKIETLINQIQYQSTKDSLTNWVNKGEQNLIEGAVCIARLQYPLVELNTVEDALEKIKKDVWLELNESLTALEKVKTLNHILYGVYGFTANTTNFFAPQNHFINQVIENRKGGPVALAICYSVIAQKLGLPIYGVSLPKNFLLAYKDRYQSLASASSNPETILFYINPFNRGSVVSRKEIESFLVQNNLELKEEYFLPCSNRTTISQLIASLMIAYQKMGSTEKIAQLQNLLDITTRKLDEE